MSVGQSEHETRECARVDCTTIFRCRKDSTRKFCEEHTGGIGRSGRALTGEEHRASTKERLEADPEVAKRQLERFREENKSLRSALSKATKEDIRTEEIREKCYEIAGLSPSPPEWLFTPSVGGVPGIPITTWSDWHFGEVVRPEEVGYVNEFNSTIAVERAEYLVQTIINLCFGHMVKPTYPGIVVNLAGDMITGDIHEELQDTNDLYTFQSLLQVQDTVAAGLKLLADMFGNVFVPCVPGNHGRNTKKPRTKGRAYTSFEWHMYCQLARYFESDPRVQFLVSNEADAHYRVYDHRYMLTHGESLGVKGGDGIIGALGPIMRGTIKIGRAEAQIGRDFDTLVMGHWHQWISLKGLEVNGALKGYDEYARLGIRATYERPTQALWFNHAKYGLTAKWPVYLESQEKPDDLPWVSWKGA